MGAKAREVPKMIAAFGAREFEETGAEAVEVLRVKAETIRKYFKQLHGTAFLVGVINRDRVRVYFFSPAGTLLLGENMDEKTYGALRLTARLLSRYEKPREPTPEELRMEATEELRGLLSRSIKRVARLLGVSEPRFPSLYVSRGVVGESNQSFGMRIEDDGVLFFEENSVNAPWVEGLAIRAGFVLCCPTSSMRDDFTHLVGNAISFSELRPPVQEKWLEAWKTRSKNSALCAFIPHFIKNSETYSHRGFRWLLSLIEAGVGSMNSDVLLRALETLHTSLEVPVGTEELHLIKGLLSTLNSPHRLNQRRHTDAAMHLAPRAVCNTSLLGSELMLRICAPEEASLDSRVRVRYLEGSIERCLELGSMQGERVLSLSYHLDLDDMVPKSGGVMSHGRAVVAWALSRIGLREKDSTPFHIRMSFGSHEQLPADLQAVLERLAIGQLEVLSDTLIGSTQRVESLVRAGHVVLLPDFSHIGVEPSLLLSGPAETVEDVSSRALEATVFNTGNTGYAIVSATATWERAVLSEAVARRVAVYPILASWSSCGLLRHEELMPKSVDGLLWR
ncbi:MAG: hypothetical protein HXY34_10450 [Candidatus Thorarchaeota archaeon]|nr:hypothetical protein [Candidatus Thorarchaeota archaeon]